MRLEGFCSSANDEEIKYMFSIMGSCASTYLMVVMDLGLGYHDMVGVHMSQGTISQVTAYLQLSAVPWLWASAFNGENEQALSGLT